MYLTKHTSPGAGRWALDGILLSPDFDFKQLLTLSWKEMEAYLSSMVTGDTAAAELAAPIENDQEVWACGVTYSRSRDAREAETDIKDVYDKVYAAQRPELFFKAIGWRVQGNNSVIRIRKDSQWNVPEPELTLVINCSGEIVGYCVGNDVSSRQIEGANPLYLPQAKIYDGACALGPGIVMTAGDHIGDLPIRLTIDRQGKTIFEDETRSSHMKRTLEELVAYLMMEMTFPHGVFLMTGTGIIPPEKFTLQVDDKVTIRIDRLVLENVVES
ncbi:MAG: fumarylacetoacetate hydrolase family protein [Fidelibacterota bacterium]|nr:MAG: fumarylacetoacetate hydrolase family protein [Candidatus Neomarinimicrobiota bacterium]